jgi:uncharacterized protein VirK/YbjX
MNEMQREHSQQLLKYSVALGLPEESVAPSGGADVLHKPHNLFCFPKRLLILARQKHSWSPALIADEFWRFITNIGRYREIRRLLKNHLYAEIVENNPGFAFKYIVPNYLARGLTVRERATCFLHHHGRMHAILSECALRQILQGEVTLHEIDKGDNRFALTICQARYPFDKEGELIINLKVNGKIVFILSFTIVPGWVVRSKVAQIVLLTCLQGISNCYPQIKLATKSLHEVGPSALLLAALEGVADAFGIGEIVAVGATNQSFYCKEFAASFKSAYDEFFAQLVMTKTAEGFFCCPVPIEDKPLEFIKQGHKLRTKGKRAFKQQIRLACASRFLRLARRSPEPALSAP